MLVLLAGGAAAALLVSSEERPAPPKRRAFVTAEPAAPLPLAYRPEPEPQAKPKARPKPEPAKKREAPKRIRVDKVAARPVSVRVRSAGIDAPTIPLGLEDNGKLEVPENFSQAGWREGGPEPGERGAAMITAHFDSRTGPGAFYSLGKVSQGTEIDVVRKDGSTVTFVAERSERVSKDDFPTERVYGDTRLPTLRLVTCAGAFNEATGHYTDNLIVYATRQAS